jgi:hypothetical protein
MPMHSTSTAVTIAPTDRLSREQARRTLRSALPACETSDLEPCLDLLFGDRLHATVRELLLNVFENMPTGFAPTEE